MMPDTTAHPRVRIWTGDDQSRFIDLAPDDIMGFEAQASIDQPGGTFTIAVSPKKGAITGGRLNAAAALVRDLKPRSVVSIGYDKPGGIMLGLLSGARQTVRVFGGQANDTVVLHGRSIGMPLAEDQIVNARMAGQNAVRFRETLVAALGADTPMLAFFPALMGPKLNHDASQANTFQGAAIRDVVEWILDHAPSMRIPLLRAAIGGARGVRGNRSTADGSIGRYLNTDRSVTAWNKARVWTDALQQYNGTIWGWLQSALDVDFYELFVDTEPTDGMFPRADLIVRPKPFDDSLLEVLPTGESTFLDWPNLKTRWNGRQHHVLDEVRLMSHSLGWDDADIMTFFLVTSECDVAASGDAMRAGLAFPVVDLYNMGIHGIKPYKTSVTLLGSDIARKADGDDTYTGQVVTETTEFRNRLVNWHRFNGWMSKGSIKVLGRDEYRPGEPYFLPWAMARAGAERGLRCYGTSVTWAWQLGEPYTTTIELSRGYNRSCIQAARATIAAAAPADNPSMLAVG